MSSQTISLSSNSEMNLKISVKPPIQRQIPDNSNSQPSFMKIEKNPNVGSKTTESLNSKNMPNLSDIIMGLASSSNVNSVPSKQAPLKNLEKNEKNCDNKSSSSTNDQTISFTKIIMELEKRLPDHSLEILLNGAKHLEQKEKDVKELNARIKEEQIKADRQTKRLELEKKLFVETLKDYGLQNLM